MTPLKTLATLAALLAAPAAFAQNQPSAIDNTCNASVIPDMVLGDYSITAGPLGITINGHTMIHDPETTGPGTIYAGALNEFIVRMLPPVPDWRLEETDRMQPDWYWDAAPAGSQGPGFFISSRDLELLSDCTIREMPRFIGTFQTHAVDGTPVDHTIRVVMVLPDWLVGSWRFTAPSSGGPIQGLRSVAFSRTAP